MNPATNYLGLHLRSPIVPSACPLTENLDNIKRMEDAGAAAITTLEQELAAWLESHEYESISQLQGCMSQLNCSDPSAFERAQYVRAVARPR